MALRRFWIDAAVLSETPLRIGGDLFHHIKDVCRFDRGDRFEVLPGDGKAYLAEITGMHKRELEAKILSQRQIEALKKPWIHLALSVPKYPKVDFIIEKSVELGVQSVSLLLSDFSFPRKLSDLSESRMQRWQKINRAAAQQSGRGTLMELAEPTTLAECLQAFRGRDRALGLFPYEGEAATPWQMAIRAGKNQNLDEVWVFVGSEGGFSKEEVQLFREFGLEPMTMGPQILRVETACVALVSVIKYEFEA